MFIKVLNRIERMVYSIFDFFTGIFMSIWFVLLNIQFGRGILFFGRMHVRKHPDSKIIIGDDCRFRNRYHSNLIGINHPCMISTHSPEAVIQIGKGCGFSGTTIGAFTSIVFGDNVRCGANTLITDGDWHLDDPRVGLPKKVEIRSNVWLGYGVIVMKGVTIGENSIIGAGSVVVSDVPPNCIAAGNPCKVIKTLDEKR
jgi:acetyltransferase-like isoleucine patch superfamily enzyme